MWKKLVSHSAWSTDGSLCGKILRGNGSYKTDKSESYENKTTVHYIWGVAVLDADIHYRLDHDRHKQIKASHKKLEKGRKNAFKLVFFQIRQNRLHFFPLKDSAHMGAPVYRDYTTFFTINQAQIKIYSPFVAYNGKNHKKIRKKDKKFSLKFIFRLQ